MDDPDPDHYLACFDSSWCDTEAWSWFDGERLVAVAIVDRLADALSAVYTMSDPTETRRGLGNYAVLQQMELAHEAGYAWVYLGYWIGACEKMAYKLGYRPLEWFDSGHWRRLEHGDAAPG